MHQERSAGIQRDAENASHGPITVPLPDELLEQVAQRAATILASQLSISPPPDVRHTSGYLAPAAAAAYLGVSRQRIHSLTSARALRPDGRDGRTPLYTRATLDRCVRACAARH